MLIIVVLGVIYTAITSRSEGQRGLTVSKKAAVVLTLLFLLAIILVLLAYLILNLDPLQTLVLVGWMILMLAALFISRIVPDSQVFLKSLLANLAAFSLGGGIAIRGAPCSQAGSLSRRSSPGLPHNTEQLQQPHNQ